MKKLFAVLFVAAALVAGAFAADFPTGSWIDENYDAEWVISADSKIELKDSKTGVVYCKFDKAKMENYKVGVDTDGAYISFYYAETARAYKFVKPVTLSSDLKLIIKADWAPSEYKVNIKFNNGKLF